MQLYNEKNSDYFASARTEILDFLPKFSVRVLEIGCGAGQTLEMLKKQNLCSETVGIELFASAAHEAAGRVDSVFCMDIEKSLLPDNIGRFDLILMLDVLEHLVDPWSLLSHVVRAHLAAAGTVIVSLPNARHFSLVWPLLCGRFEYAERGILDKTHLRFFTKSSATKLVETSGLKVDLIKSTSLGLHLNSGKLNAVTFGLFSGFLTSQYLFKAAPRDLNI